MLGRFGLGIKKHNSHEKMLLSKLRYDEKRNLQVPWYGILTLAISKATAFASIAALKQDQTVSSPFLQHWGPSFVGIVQDANDLEKGVRICNGDRVVSIGAWKTHTGHVSISPEKLLVVPNELDPSDIACIITAYLPAFQALHHGKPSSFRYQKACLRGKRILITGGVCAQSQALIRLARLAGAKEVLLLAPIEHREYVDRKHAQVVEDDEYIWLPKLYGRMDLVIALDAPIGFFLLRQCMARKARLVYAPRCTGMLTTMRDVCELATIQRASLLNFEQHFNTYQQDVWEDLSYLLRLLAKRQLRPVVDRFISPTDICSVTETEQPLNGCIVCEHWRR